MGFDWDVCVAMMYGIEVEVQQTNPYMIWRRLVLHNELQAGPAAGTSAFIGVTTPIDMSDENSEENEEEMEEWYDFEFGIENVLDNHRDGNRRLTSEFSKAVSIALGREDHGICLVSFYSIQFFREKFGEEARPFRALVVYGPSITFANDSIDVGKANVNLPWGSCAKPAPPVPEGVQEDIEAVIATLGMQKVYDGKINWSEEDLKKAVVDKASLAKLHRQFWHLQPEQLFERIKILVPDDKDLLFLVENMLICLK